MLNRYAIFVDAGYLYAQGSVAIAGVKQERRDLVLDIDGCMKALVDYSRSVDGSPSFLRTYWYDGLSGGRENAEQARVADAAYVKARYGIINAHNQQKGVDTLIVTDLVDLARSGAISSAMLLSGDEDVRIGVEIAQRYGVRVHLLGIAPSRGSQSLLLLREADTNTEWTADDVRSFLSFLSPTRQTSHELTAVSASNPGDNTSESDFNGFAKRIGATVSGSDYAEIISSWERGSGIPHPIDKQLMGYARSRLGRLLSPQEMRDLRGRLVEHLRSNLSPPSGV